jgi:hypothetical protein
MEEPLPKQQPEQQIMTIKEILDRAKDLHGHLAQGMLVISNMAGALVQITDRLAAAEAKVPTDTPSPSRIIGFPSKES